MSSARFMSTDGTVRAGGRRWPARCMALLPRAVSPVPVVPPEREYTGSAAGVDPSGRRTVVPTTPGLGAAEPEPEPEPERARENPPRTERGVDGVDRLPTFAPPARPVAPPLPSAPAKCTARCIHVPGVPKSASDFFLDAPYSKKCTGTFLSQSSCNPLNALASHSYRRERFAR